MSHDDVVDALAGDHVDAVVDRPVEAQPWSPRDLRAECLGPFGDALVVARDKGRERVHGGQYPFRHPACEPLALLDR